MIYVMISYARFKELWREIRVHMVSNIILIFCSDLENFALGIVHQHSKIFALLIFRVTLDYTALIFKDTLNDLDWKLTLSV